MSLYICLYLAQFAYLSGCLVRVQALIRVVSWLAEKKTQKLLTNVRAKCAPFSGRPGVAGASQATCKRERRCGGGGGCFSSRLASFTFQFEGSLEFAREQLPPSRKVEGVGGRHHSSFVSSCLLTFVRSLVRSAERSNSGARRSSCVRGELTQHKRRDLRQDATEPIRAEPSRAGQSLVTSRASQTGPDSRGPLPSASLGGPSSSAASFAGADSRE